MEVNKPGKRQVFIDKNLCERNGREATWPLSLISLHWWVIGLKCKVGAIKAHCDIIKIRLSLLKRTFQPSKIHWCFKIDKARFVHCIRRWQSARKISATSWSRMAYAGDSGLLKEESDFLHVFNQSFSAKKYIFEASEP